MIPPAPAHSSSPPLSHAHTGFTLQHTVLLQELSLHNTDGPDESLTTSHGKAPRVELPGHTDDPETHRKAAARRERARTGAQPRTHLDDGGVLRECVLSFRGLTHGDVLDVASPENDVLVNLLSRRGRPVCGAVFSTEGPHLGWRKTVTPSSSAKGFHQYAPPAAPACPKEQVATAPISVFLLLQPFPTEDSYKTPVGKAPESSRSQTTRNDAQAWQSRDA